MSNLKDFDIIFRSPSCRPDLPELKEEEKSKEEENLQRLREEFTQKQNKDENHPKTSYSNNRQSSKNQYNICNKSLSADKYKQKALNNHYGNLNSNNHKSNFTNNNLNPDKSNECLLQYLNYKNAIISLKI